MKKIKVDEKNIAKIEAVIADVEQRASVRRIYFDDVFTAVEIAEKQLSKFLPKKSWVGARIAYDKHASTFPSAYRGTPESTRIVLERNTAGWNLTECFRGFTQGANSKMILTITPEAEAEIASFVLQYKNW